MFTLPLDSVMWCCEVQIFSNLFVTLEGARLSMKPAQKNPNQVLEEKLSYNDIIWLLIPVLSEAGSTLGHFQTYTFLHRLSQFRWIFLSLAKKKKSQTDLICHSPAHLWSWAAESTFMFQVGNDSLRRWLIQTLFIWGTWTTQRYEVG